MAGLETGGASRQEFSAENTEQNIVNSLAASIKELATHRIRYESEGLSNAEIFDKLVSEREVFAEAMEAAETWEANS